jgi:glyoxylase-like metal-dependent hydrolase (beta-lactamase superfamily II)
VLCTHFHPDHMGLAHWLCKGEDFGRGQIPLWINFAEYSAARIWSQPQTDYSTMADYFHRHGVHHPETLEKLRQRKNIYPTLVPAVPQSFRRIFPNEVIRMGEHDWQVIPGYGHSPEHAALYCKALNLLISGDMLLPKISTNMSVWAQEPDANPLKLYLDSLDLFDPLSENTLVLPSHGKPFGAQLGGQSDGQFVGQPADTRFANIHGGGGIHTRLRQLRDHHRDRLEETRQACRQPVTAAQVLPILFRRELDLHQITFALGETIAHLNFLMHAGEIKRHEDPHGVVRFSTN